MVWVTVLVFLLLSKEFPAWKHTVLTCLNILLGTCHFWGRHRLREWMEKTVVLKTFGMDWEDTCVYLGWGWPSDRWSWRSQSQNVGCLWLHMMCEQSLGERGSLTRWLRFSNWNPCGMTQTCNLSALEAGEWPREFETSSVVSTGPSKKTGKNSALTLSQSSKQSVST